MGKASKEAHNAKGTRPVLLFDPEDLVLVDDQGSAIFDERINLEIKEEFILNIMAYGVIEPIVVRKNPETGKTEVVAGRRRTLGCREANKRLKKKGEEPHWIPAVVKRGESHVLAGVMISENAHREDDTPLGQAKKVARYLDLGRSEEEAAIAIGKSVSTVKNLLRLLEAPADVRRAVENGKISAADGYKLAKLEPDEAKKRLAKLPPPGETTKGKKTRSAARKVRDEALGTGNGVPGKRDVKAKLDEIQKNEKVKENHRIALEAAFFWFMGDKGPLESLLA